MSKMPRLSITPDLARAFDSAQKKPLSSAKHALQIVPAQLRVWLSDQNDVACRPWYIFCLELYPRGQVINQIPCNPASEKPNASSILSFLLRHISNPPSDEISKRPTHVSFVDAHVTKLLQPHLKRLKIDVGTLTIADGLDDYIKKFSNKLIEMERASRGDAAERPGLLSVKNITPLMAGEMANAAVNMFRDATWHRIPEHLALEVRLPTTGNDKYRDKYYVTVLGSDKKGVQGFALMASLSNLRDKYRRAMLSKTGNTADSDEEGEQSDKVDRKKSGLSEEDVLLCAGCGRRVGQTFSSDGAKYVERCGGCKRLLYCNGTCQKLDWRKRHRNECEAAKDDKAYAFKRDEWAWLKRELALLFLDPTSIPFDDLEAYEEHGWRFVDFVSPPLYPLPFVTIQTKGPLGNKMDRPMAKELHYMTLIAKALTEIASPPPQEGILHLASGVSISFAENLAESIRA